MLNNREERVCRNAKELGEADAFGVGRLGLPQLHSAVTVGVDVYDLANVPLRESSLVSCLSKVVRIPHASQYAPAHDLMSSANMRACLTKANCALELAGMAEPLGAEIRRLRLLKRPKMRQSDLANLIGQPDAAMVNRYENGKVTPTRETLARIAVALGVRPGHFDAFGGGYRASDPRITRRQKRSAVAAGHGGADLPSGAAASGADGGDPLKDLLYDMFMLLPPLARREWLQRLAVATKLEETSEPAHPKSKAGGDA